MATRRAIRLLLVSAGLLAAAVLPARAVEMVSASASVRNVDLSIWINGVAVERFSGTQSGGLPLVLWVVDGANTVAVRAAAAGADPDAVAEVTVTGRDPVLEYAWEADGRAAEARFEMTGVPAWRWQAAPARPDARPEVIAALQAAHAALTAGDAEAFRRHIQAHLDDAAKLIGEGQAEAMADDLFAALSRTPRPLPELSARAYRDGQIWKLTGPEGRGALSADTDDGGITSFGRFWAFLDGRWQIVR